MPTRPMPDGLRLPCAVRIARWPSDAPVASYDVMGPLESPAGHLDAKLAGTMRTARHPVNLPSKPFVQAHLLPFGIRHSNRSAGGSTVWTVIV
jgi:hypothetical protein